MVAKMNHKLMVDENVNNKNNIINNYWAKKIYCTMINIELLIFGKCLLVPTHQEKKHKINQKNLQVKK
jgi:hypothetical protein